MITVAVLMFLLGPITGEEISEIHFYRSEMVNVFQGEEKISQAGLPETSADTVHVVQQGETLYSISKIYQVSVSQLQEWNSLQDTRIGVGDVLRVAPYQGLTSNNETSKPESIEISEVSPLDPPSPEIAKTGLKAEPVDRSVTYTVRSGDTLYGLSQRFNVTVQGLRSLNNLTSDQLFIGQVLVLRREQITPSVADELPENRPQGMFHTYQVGRNETLSQVLTRFAMDEIEFSALNPGVNPKDVAPGQKIVVLLPPDRSFENPYAQTGPSGQKERVLLLVYAENERATPTASGELVNPITFTAAHSSFPLGTRLLVENPSTGRSTLVRVNDRFRGSGLKVTPAVLKFLELSAENDRVTGTSTEAMISQID